MNLTTIKKERLIPELTWEEYQVEQSKAGQQANLGFGDLRGGLAQRVLKKYTQFWDLRDLEKALKKDWLAQRFDLLSLLEEHWGFKVGKESIPSFSSNQPGRPGTGVLDAYWIKSETINHRWAEHSEIDQRDFRQGPPDWAAVEFSGRPAVCLAIWASPSLGKDKIWQAGLPLFPQTALELSGRVNQQMTVRWWMFFKPEWSLTEAPEPKLDPILLAKFDGSWFKICEWGGDDLWSLT